MYDHRSRNKRIVVEGVFAVLALTGLLFVPVLPFIAPANAATGRIDVTQFQLEITPIAPKLPADGGTYYAMIELQNVKDKNPIAAPFDFDITIISSDPSVLSGQEKATLKKGESLVKAELTTTNKAGEVSISAQGEGLKSDSVTINTLLLDSLDPTKLALYAAPPSAVPDPKIVGTLYIQLLNSRNLPATSEEPILVSLSSSKPQFGTVPSYATIPAGQSGVTVDFKANYEIGITRIAASAPGLSPAQLDLKADGPLATKLVVEFGPSKIPAVSAFQATMSVQLRDDNDNPVKATQDVEVTLKSSDRTVAVVEPILDIKAGESYATAAVKAVGGMACTLPNWNEENTGCAVITASASGFESGIGTLRVVPQGDEVGPYAIYLYSVPSILPPDNSEHSAIIMQVMDITDDKHPLPFHTPSFYFKYIELSTSDSKIGSILTPYESRIGYAEAKFKTTYVQGTTTITASSTGLITADDKNFSPGQIDLEVRGSAPAGILLTQIPTIIQANSQQSDPLSVSLVDSAGKPVIAPEEVVVYLSSSNPSIATLPSYVVIPAGSSYVIQRVSVTDRMGETTISASTSTLASGNLLFKTVGSKGTISQYALGLLTVPKLSADTKEYEAVFIQLQDLTGNPVAAKNDVRVTLSSSSILAGKVQPEVIIPAGSSYAVAKFMTTISADKSITITASSPGLKSVDAVMQTTVQPLTVKIVNSVPRQGSFTDEDIYVEVEVKSGSLPLEGATIEVGGPHAEPSYAVTDEFGHAEARYVSTLPGSNNIEVKATKPGFAETVARTTITLSQTVNVIVKAVSEGGTEIATPFKIAAASATSKTYNSDEGAPVRFTNAKWGAYRVSAPEEYSNSEGTYKFVSWKDGVTDNPRSFQVATDTTIEAIYSAKFLMQVTSDYGTTSGAGYYNEGDKATISIDTTSTSTGLIDKTFEGWSGDIRSESPTTQLTVDGPKVIKAEWHDNYLKLAILAAGIGAAGIISYIKFIKPRREQAAKKNAPDLDWYKS